MPRPLLRDASPERASSGRSTRASICPSQNAALCIVHHSFKTNLIYPVRYGPGGASRPGME
eukprot:7440237-Pyramimonas_sp.AAC.1